MDESTAELYGDRIRSDCFVSKGMDGTYLEPRKEEMVVEERNIWTYRATRRPGPSIEIKCSRCDRDARRKEGDIESRNVSSAAVSVDSLSLCLSFTRGLSRPSDSVVRILNFEDAASHRSAVSDSASVINNSEEIDKVLNTVNRVLEHTSLARLLKGSDANAARESHLENTRSRIAP